MCLDLYVHWVSRSMHLTELKQSDWVIRPCIINEFEKEYSQSRGNLNRCDGPFFLNEQGDLYFLLHKNIVHIILLNLEKKIKKFVGRKTRYSRKRAQNRYSNMQIMITKTTTLRTLYVHVVSNCVNCPQILYDIVLYAPHFLPVTFFPKCYL